MSCHAAEKIWQKTENRKVQSHKIYASIIRWGCRIRNETTFPTIFCKSTKNIFSIHVWHSYPFRSKEIELNSGKLNGRKTNETNSRRKSLAKKTLNLFIYPSHSTRWLMRKYEKNHRFEDHTIPYQFLFVNLYMVFLTLTSFQQRKIISFFFCLLACCYWMLCYMVNEFRRGNFISPFLFVFYFCIFIQHLSEIKKITNVIEIYLVLSCYLADNNS